jgi:ArsR family transcriptional regulator
MKTPRSAPSNPTRGNARPTARRPAPRVRPAGQAPDAADVELATLAKALAHPARVAILRTLLQRGECVCGTIVNTLPLAQATVSQHLKTMKEAGLVQGEVDGPRVCYCASPPAVRRLKELIGAL